ncbi:cytochrome c biogenesis CcdA family protein [Gloeothece verrucosa]|uniref:Cytochrome c biogenesis protein transmembrane region n=1 Tax=Gloeothece verrucosa (strain PCC 7822) TaxID=497965 RepID=E0UIR4_GLOV7|nr:cytochrome c biogenesis protein CcdA [Gloeothece verrucosa]ADN13373.1 cytochrome c biogenesis protein transmembrane region [Gloeothece verrucosa PCC 7822]
MSATVLSVGLAFLAGFVTVLSPCILPIIPLLIGRSFQSHRFGPMFLVFGLISGFAVAGSLLGVAASWLSELAGILRTVALALLFILGLLAIFPQWSYRLFSLIPVGKSVKQALPLGLLGEFYLGTQLGLLWTPCAGPVLGSILVLAAVQHQIFAAFALLVTFGMGSAVPLLVIAYGGRYLSQRLLGLRFHSYRLQRLGGILLVGGAIIILLGWDIKIQLLLAPLFPKLPL